jgi:hypothetical protein
MTLMQIEMSDGGRKSMSRHLSWQLQRRRYLLHFHSVTCGELSVGEVKTSPFTRSLPSMRRMVYQFTAGLQREANMAVFCNVEA